MNGITWDQSPITGVVAAENAWGTLTTLYTSKMNWKGFRVISQSQDTYYTSFIQIYAGSAPIGPILVSDGAPDSCWDYFIPGDFPAGTVFGAEVWYNTTAANNCNIGLIGLSKPDIECVGSTVLGVIAGSGTVSSAAAAWTSIGSFPSIPIKKMRLGIQNSGGYNSGETVELAVGASSTTLTTLLTLQFGNSGKQYGWVRPIFDLGRDFSGLQLWANPTQECGVHAYLYY